MHRDTLALRIQDQEPPHVIGCDGNGACKHFLVAELQVLRAEGGEYFHTHLLTVGDCNIARCSDHEVSG